MYNCNKKRDVLWGEKDKSRALPGSREATIENRTAKFTHTNHGSGVCELGEVAEV